jgi:hypothetical protein
MAEIAFTFNGKIGRLVAGSIEIDEGLSSMLDQ